LLPDTQKKVIFRDDDAYPKGLATHLVRAESSPPRLSTAAVPEQTPLIAGGLPPEFRRIGHRGQPEVARGNQLGASVNLGDAAAPFLRIAQRIADGGIVFPTFVTREAEQGPVLEQNEGFSILAWAEIGRERDDFAAVLALACASPDSDPSCSVC